MTSSPDEKTKCWDVINGEVLKIHIFSSSSIVSLIADCHLILAIHYNWTPCTGSKEKSIQWPWKEEKWATDSLGEVYKASFQHCIIGFYSETWALKHKNMPVIGVSVQSDPPKKGSQANQHMVCSVLC